MGYQCGPAPSFAEVYKRRLARLDLDAWLDEVEHAPADVLDHLFSRAPETRTVRAWLLGKVRPPPPATGQRRCTPPFPQPPPMEIIK